MTRPEIRSVLIIGHLGPPGSFCSSFGQALADRLERRGWKVYRASPFKNPLLYLMHISATILLRRNQYQTAVIQVFSGRAFLWAEISAFLLRLCAKSYWLSFHGGALPAFASAHPRRISRLVAGASRLSTPSKMLQGALKTFGNEPLYLPNAIDVKAHFYRCREHVRPEVVWLRAFHEIYNPVMAVETVRLLREKGMEVHLRMIGPDMGDGSFEKVKGLIAEYQLEKLISIVAGIPKEKVPDALSKADIFLNTTSLESYGNAVMEAAATGLCIISTCAGEIPLLWRDQEEVILVSQGNSEAMADAVCRILGEKGLAARLSSKARAKAESVDWSLRLPEWEQMLESLIRSPG